MPGLVPGIHVFDRDLDHDVDGLDKPGHDRGGAYRKASSLGRPVGPKPGRPLHIERFPPN